MRAFNIVVSSIFLFGALTGCESVSMPYVMKTDRVDQKMDIGNRGYLKGTPPPLKDRGDLKRPFIAVDVDLVETEEKEKPFVETEAARETREEAPLVERRAPIREEEIK